jgi:hypothetical protein
MMVSAKTAKRIFRGSFAVAFVAVSVHLSVFGWLTAYRPTSPDKALGFEIPINNHGELHYISEHEKRILDLSWIVFWVGFGATSVSWSIIFRNKYEY